jgi:hypothetical protein
MQFCRVSLFTRSPGEHSWILHICFRMLRGTEGASDGPTRLLPGSGTLANNDELLTEESDRETTDQARLTGESLETNPDPRQYGISCWSSRFQPPPPIPLVFLVLAHRAVSPAALLLRSPIVSQLPGYPQNSTARPSLN